MESALCDCTLSFCYAIIIDDHQAICLHLLDVKRCESEWPSKYEKMRSIKKTGFDADPEISAVMGIYFSLVQDAILE